MNETIMAQLKIVLSFFLIIGLASSDFVHKSDKTFSFTKANDGSNEFKFEYDSGDGGDPYRSDTFVLGKDKNIYVMIGKDETIYYAEFTSDELNNEKTFSKADVRIAQRADNEIEVRDNFSIYRVSIPDGTLTITPYTPAWDVDNFCFTSAKTANQTFDFTISSLNNLRKYSGTTYRETDDPHVQRVDIIDGASKSFFEVLFTEKELQSKETFCRGYTKKFGVTEGFGIQTGEINPKLLEALSLNPKLLAAHSLNAKHLGFYGFFPLGSRSWLNSYVG